MKDHGRQQETDSLGSSVNCSCKTTGLPTQVKVQIQTQKMIKNIACNFSNRFLRNTCKHGVSQFLEHRSANSRGSVCIYELDFGCLLMSSELTSYNHRPCHSVCGATHGCEIDVHRVDDILEVEGNFDIEDLADIVSD